MKRIPKIIALFLFLISLATQPERAQLDEQANSERAESEQENTLSLIIPTLGTIAFQDVYSPGKDPKMVGTITQGGTDLNPGLIEFQPDSKFEYSLKEGLVLKAQAKIFGQIAPITIKKLDEDEALLLIAARKPITMQLLGQKVTLKNPVLRLRTNQAPVIEATANIFKQNIPITFDYDQEGQAPRARFTIPTFISGLITKNSSQNLNKIPMKNVAFSISNVNTDNQDATFSGEATLVPLNISIIPSRFLASKQVRGSLKNTRLTLQTYLEKGALPHLQALGDLDVSISAPTDKVAQPDIQLVAKGSKISIPGAQLLTADLTIRIINKKAIFEADLGDFTIGFLTIRQTKLTLQDNVYELSGETTFHNHIFVIHLAINNSSKQVTLNGYLKQQTAIYPFQTTELPHLKDIKLENIFVKLAGHSLKPESIIIGGKATILNTPFESELIYLIGDLTRQPSTGQTQETPDQQEKAKQSDSSKFGGVQGIVLKAHIAPGWKFSDTFTFLKGQSGDLVKKIGFSFDQIDFSRGTFIAASKPYRDTELGIDIPQGLALLSKLNLSKSPLEKVAKLVKDRPPVAALYGSIPSDIRQFKLGALLGKSLQIDQKSGLRTGPLTLEITGKPSLVLVSSLFFRPPLSNDELNFSARLEPQIAQIALSASMQGKWRNFLGLKGLDCEDLVLDTGISYAGGIPDEIGMAGTVYIGNVNDSDKIKLMLRGKASADLSQTYFEGEIKNLTFNHILKIGKASGISIDPKALNMPDFGLEELLIKIAPKDGSLGAISYQEGTTLKGTMRVGDIIKKASAEISVNKTGITLKGFMSPTQFGPLTITGPGPDNIYGTADDGALIELTISQIQQSFLVRGRASLLGVTSESDIEITKESVAIRKLDFMLFDILKTHFEAQNHGTMAQPKWHLKGTVEQGFENFSQKLENEVIAWLKQAKKDVEAAEQESTKKLEEEQARIKEKSKGKGVVEKTFADIAHWFIGAAKDVSSETLKVTGQGLSWIQDRKKWIDDNLKFGEKAAILDIKKTTIEIDDTTFIFKLEDVTFLGKQRPSADIVIDLQELINTEKSKMIDFITAKMVQDLANLFGTTVPKPQK